MNAALLQEINDVQCVLDGWYRQSSAQLELSHSSLVEQLRDLERRLSVGCASVNDAATPLAAARRRTAASPASATRAAPTGSLPPPGNAFAPAAHGGPSGANALLQHISAEALRTPMRASFMDECIATTPALSTTPLHRTPAHAETMLEELISRSNRKRAESEVGGKPLTSSSSPLAAEARTRGTTVCQVLVQFKRNRTLLYDSPFYVAVNEYVVVGGDRGEDIGLVVQSWTDAEGARRGHATDDARKEGDAEGEKESAPSPETKWAEGVGEVLRVATALEVTQLQSMQSELEKRAVEVAQEKVQENGLPMRIVDAEYQFDRRKLTFYYQSQHRLDFRNLVRDLYKTFRARIWMEPDTPSA